MHPENIPLFLLLPALLWIIGLIQIYRNLGPKTSKQLTQSFFYPVIAVLLASLILLMSSNSNNLEVNTEVFILFVISLILEGLSSLVCIVYTNFKGFLPTIFYRTTFIFALFCVVLSTVISLSNNRLEFNEEKQNNNSEFQKVN